MKKIVSMAIILCMVLTGCNLGGKKDDDSNVAAVQEYSTVYSGEVST